MTRGKWASLLLGFAGVALISYQALTGPEAYSLSGVLLTLAASMGASGGSVTVKNMRLLEGLLAVTAWQLVLDSLPLLLLSPVFEGAAHVDWKVNFLVILLFLGLVGTALATAAWYWLIERDDVDRLTMFLYLVPVLGLVMATLIYSDGVGPVESIGILLSLAGTAGVAREPWHDIASLGAASSK